MTSQSAVSASHSATGIVRRRDHLVVNRDLRRRVQCALILRELTDGKTDAWLKMKMKMGTLDPKVTNTATVAANGDYGVIHFCIKLIKSFFNRDVQAINIFNFLNKNCINCS